MSAVFPYDNHRVPDALLTALMTICWSRPAGSHRSASNPGRAASCGGWPHDCQLLAKSCRTSDSRCLMVCGPIASLDVAGYRLHMVALKRALRRSTAPARLGGSVPS